MSSSEFPHPIGFDEIQVGDTIQGVFEGVSRTGVVARKDSAYACTAENGYILSRSAESITLLDRPVKRGPVFDATPGSLWTDPRTPGSVAAAFDDRRLDDSRMFVWLVGRDPGTWLSDKDRAHLVPFQAPSVDAERERLRSNLVYDATKWVEGHSPGAIFAPEFRDLVRTVRALRDYEAAEKSS